MVESFYRHIVIASGLSKEEADFIKGELFVKGFTSAYARNNIIEGFDIVIDNRQNVNVFDLLDHLIVNGFSDAKLE